jgi:hypothetical protein
MTVLPTAPAGRAAPEALEEGAPDAAEPDPEADDEAEAEVRRDVARPLEVAAPVPEMADEAEMPGAAVEVPEAATLEETALGISVSQSYEVGQAKWEGRRAETSSGGGNNLRGSVRTGCISTSIGAGSSISGTGSSIGGRGFSSAVGAISAGGFGRAISSISPGTVGSTGIGAGIRSGTVAAGSSIRGRRSIP